MITREMIRRGIEDELIRLIVDPNMERGSVCQIGDNWFYFGGQTAEELNPVEYYTFCGEDVVDEIFETLSDFQCCEELKDEYDYYEMFLMENEEVIRQKGANCMKLYILSEVIEREISTPAIFPHHEAAYTEMERRFNEADFHDEGEICYDYAYCTNLNHDNCDWKINEIEI